MMLRLGSFVAMAVVVAGCTGGVIGATAGGDNGETTADIRLESAVHKKRDLRPLRGAERIYATATRDASAPTTARLLGPAGGATPNAVASALQPALTYRNGPMLDSVEVYAVFWGANVNAQVQSGVSGFFGGITGSASPIQQMLAEYNVTMPAAQTIGNGVFKQAVTDMDAPMPSDNIITDQMIEAEAARLADTGLVPAEDGKNILMFFFPPGIKVDQGGGTMSCEVFCAYHSSFTRNGHNFFYGVIPDQGSGGCEQGCGLTKDQLNTTYSTTSHELIEAITDAAVGANDLAWYDDNFGEIGDICIEWDGSSNGYYVQSEWSNAAHGCTDHAPTTSATIDVKYDDTVVTAAGGTATFAITSSGTATGALTLAAADLPTAANGYTATFNPASPTVGQGSTLSVAVPTGLRSQDATFKVAATDSNGVHHFAQATVHVKGAAPTITSADVTTGPSQGGTAVTLTGTNIGPGAKAYVCAASSCSQTALSKPITGQYVSGSNGTKFQLVTPSHSASTSGTTVSLVVINPNDPTQAKIAFKYTTGAAPTVAAVSPPSGPVNVRTFVTITGTNFSSNSTLKIAGQALVSGTDYAVQDDKTIIAVVPAVATAGKVDVVVGNADGHSVTMTGGFEYGKNSPPSFGNLSVDNGPTAGGTYVTIFGENFDATPTVTFGGVAAKVETVNPGFLGVVTPAHAAGMVDVVVTNGDAQAVTGTGVFTYADGAGGSGGGGSGGGGDGMGGGDGSGGGSGMGGNGPITVVGNNSIKGSTGCSMGGTGDAGSALSLVLVFGALAFALRRQRS